MNIHQSTTHQHPQTAAYDRIASEHICLQLKYTDIIFEIGRSQTYYGITFILLILAFTSISALMPWNHLHPFNPAGMLLLPLFLLQFTCTICSQRRLLSLYGCPIVSGLIRLLDVFLSWNKKTAPESRRNSNHCNHPIRLLMLQVVTLLPVTSICCWNYAPYTNPTPYIDVLLVAIIIIDVIRLIGTADTVVYPFIQDYTSWHHFCEDWLVDISLRDFIAACQQNVQ